MRHRVHGSVLAVAALLVLACTMMPAAAEAARPHKPKAHLLVRNLKVISSPAKITPDPAFPIVILESDFHGHFGFEYTVKNVGKKHSTTKHAGLYIGGNEYATQSVGPLNPGEAKTFKANLDVLFKAPGAAYRAQVCITRNCSKDVAFAAVPRRWVVNKFATGPNSLAGSAPYVSTHSDQMVFDYNGVVSVEGDPYLSWLATGSIYAETSGEADGCKYSGSGAVAHSPWGRETPDWGYLEITPKLDGYFAQIKADEAGYGGSRTCENPDFSGPFTGSYWPLETESVEGVDQDMYPAATELVGSTFALTGFGGSAVAEWSFRADLP
jgi:hypothetical protein